VVLTGGCFPKQVFDRAFDSEDSKARASGLLAPAIPPNDGGIALGQIVAASRVIEADKAV